LKTYNDTVDTGLLGERRVVGYLKKMGYTIERYNTYSSQRVKGDICVKSKDKSYDIEIKTEKANKHGNFFIEVVSNSHTDAPGWLHYCNADLLIYNFLDEDRIFCFDMKDLKRWSKHNITKFPQKVQYSCNQQNETIGYCVPIPTLTSEVKCKIHEVKTWTK